MYDKGGWGDSKAKLRPKLTLVSRIFWTKCQCHKKLHSTNFPPIVSKLIKRGLKYDMYHRFRSSDLRPKWRAGGRNWGRQRWSTFHVLRFQILWRWRGIWDRGGRAVRTLAGIPLMAKSTILHQHTKSTFTHKMKTNEDKSTNWSLAQPLKSARAHLHHLGTGREFKSSQKKLMDWIGLAPHFFSSNATFSVVTICPIHAFRSCAIGSRTNFMVDDFSLTSIRIGMALLLSKW